MKAKIVCVGRLIVYCVSACCLVQNLHAQPDLPPVPTNSPSGGTNTFDYAAYYSNNLATISDWLHDGVTNSDGSQADSMQAHFDAQAESFAASGAFSQQSSARDEALTWADLNGIPTELTSDDGTRTILYRREGNVPIYIGSFDLAGAITLGTTNLWPGGSTGLNLTGSNYVISQWDEGSPRLTHAEYAGRVSVLDGTTSLSDHSTAVAGIMSGVGINLYLSGVSIGPAAKGMAYAAQVQARQFNSDKQTMADAISTNHCRLSNHSYGVKAGWLYDTTYGWMWYGYWQIGSQDSQFGNYTADAADFDAISFGTPTYLQVWAAGNYQSYAPPVQPTNHYERYVDTVLWHRTNVTRAADGDAGGYDTLPPQAAAKNSLTVGAVNPLPSGFVSATNVTIASFSSLGPTDDGRIKPDVVADGVSNIVAVSTGDYAYGQGSGTSFAAPDVTGSIGLLEQYYKQVRPDSSELLSSTWKGIVIHTADSCTTNSGPSYKFGWGVMNSVRAAKLLGNDATNTAKNFIKEVLLNNGQYVQFPVTNAGGTNNPLKVTICWIDPPGATNASTNLNIAAVKLVNDLDLRVYSPNGTTNFPWVLNPDLTNRTSTARSAAATKGDDARNNVEQVYIPNPASGVYTVKVTHKGTLTNSQWVSITISGNVPQPAPQLKVTQVLQTATNTLALVWPAVVGGQYQVKVNTNLATTNWDNIGGVISARLTNVAAQVPMPTNGSAFYRIVQLP